MPSASYSGLEAAVEISTDGGSNWSDISESRAATLNIDGRFAEVTNRGTSIDGSGIPFVERKKIAVDWSAEINANAIDSTVFDTINSYSLNLSSLLFRFTIKETSNIPRFSGYAFPTVNYSSPETDITTARITLTAAGPLAVATQ